MGSKHKMHRHNWKHKDTSRHCFGAFGLCRRWSQKRETMQTVTRLQRYSQLRLAFTRTLTIGRSSFQEHPTGQPRMVFWTTITPSVGSYWVDSENTLQSCIGGNINCRPLTKASEKQAAFRSRHCWKIPAHSEPLQNPTARHSAALRGSLPRFHHISLLRSPLNHNTSLCARDLSLSHCDALRPDTEYPQIHRLNPGSRLSTPS